MTGPDSAGAVTDSDGTVGRQWIDIDISSTACREIDGFFRKSGKAIIALAVREILDEEIARKLA